MSAQPAGAGEEVDDGDGAWAVTGHKRFYRSRSIMRQLAMPMPIHFTGLRLVDGESPCDIK